MEGLPVTRPLWCATVACSAFHSVLRALISRYDTWEANARKVPVKQVGAGYVSFGEDLRPFKSPSFSRATMITLLQTSPSWRLIALSVDSELLLHLFQSDALRFWVDEQDHQELQHHHR